MSKPKKALQSFVREAEDLFRSSLLQTGALHSARLVTYIDIDGDGRFDSRARFPDQDLLRGLATRVRKFSLEQDPYNFLAVRSHVGAVAHQQNHDTLLDFLKWMKTAWQSSKKSWDFIPIHMGYLDPETGQMFTITPGEALDCWLYAEVVHATDPEKVRRWDRMKGYRGVENLYRWAALQSLIVQIGLAGRMLVIVREYLDSGRLPAASALVEIDHRWQELVGVSVPDPGTTSAGNGFFVKQEFVERLLDGESISTDALMNAAFPAVGPGTES